MVKFGVNLCSSPGIVEFRALTKTNPGQAVLISCAGSSEAPVADPLNLYANISGGTSSLVSVDVNRDVLNSTFSVSGQMQNEVINCTFTNSRFGVTTTSSLTIRSFGKSTIKADAYGFCCFHEFLNKPDMVCAVGLIDPLLSKWN